MSEPINTVETHEENVRPTFETTPVWKLIVLSLITFGVYDCIWSYRYWKILKKDFGYDVLPLIRAIFMGITNFWLFNILDEHMRTYNINSIRPVGLALLYILFNLFTRVDESCLFLISFFSFVPLAIIQHKINIINEKNNLPAKINRWNFANTVWSIPCFIVFVLAVVGCFLPD